MKKSEVKVLIGAMYLLLGIILLFNSFQGITGFAVFEGADTKWGSFLAGVFILIGLIVLAVSGENAIKKQP